MITLSLIQSSMKPGRDICLSWRYFLHNTTLTKMFPVTVCCYLYLFISCLEAYRSQQLLTYDKSESPSFQLNERVLKSIGSLPTPVVVISAIGNARLGKSTALNCIHYAWNGGNGTFKNDMFKTGDYQDPETRGVWVKILENQGKHDGSIVFLDVEGTNAGDRSVIDNLSIFTALLSSEIMTFTGRHVENHILDFFYRITRLFDIVTDHTKLASLPNLRVVQIGALKTRGKTQRQHVADALTSLHYKEDKYIEQRKSIARYFPGEKIEASKLVYIQSDSLHILDDFHLHQSSRYAKQIRELVNELKDVPPKRTLSGNLLDGKGFINIASKLVAKMNLNFWEDFGDQYKGIEKELCKIAANKFFSDLYNKSVKEIEDIIEVRVQKFDEECALQEERNATEKEMTRMLMGKKEIEDLIRKRQAADREKAEAIKKHKESLEAMKKKEQEYEERLKNLEKKRKEAEKERENIQQERQREREEFNQRLRLMSAMSQPKEGSLGKRLVDIFIGVGAGLLGGFLSDIRLKQNLTALPYSQYNALGLQFYRWEWNRKANALGLFGHDSGVIAQQVQMLYPNAITTGECGYKKVSYHMLDLLLRINGHSSAYIKPSSRN